MGNLISICLGKHAPHVQSHLDCSCRNDSSSSEDTPKKTWLEKHRPDKRKKAT